MTHSFFIVEWLLWSKGKSFPLVLWGRKNCWRCHRDLSLSPSHCLTVSPSPLFFSRTGSQVYDVKLFPEDPVELIVGETLNLNCTALVEFNTGVDIQWSYPGKLVRSSNMLAARVGCNITESKSKFQTVSSHQTNSWVETKPYREALSHATEAVSILTIHRVNVNDTGPYSCNVTSIDTTQTQQTQVIVYGKHQLGLPLIKHISLLT